MYPVLLKIGGFELTSYGVLVAAGYLAAILWLKRRRREMGLSEDAFWTLIYALFFGALLGAKLLYIAVSGELWADPRYGFVFFGGLLGAIAAGEWARRRLGFGYAAMSDWFGAALPLGHSIGRVGCWLAGCCYPTQLHEAGANFLIFLAGTRLLARPHKPGSVFLAYLAMYSAVRFVLEYWRLDDRGLSVAPFSVSQWIALAVGGTASVLLWKRR